MNPIQAVSLGFRGYVDFKGRSSRSEFWWWVLFATIVSMAAIILDNALGTQGSLYLNPPNGGRVILGLLHILVGLGLFLPYLAVSVRRLHDRGRSGFWLFLVLVPIIGVILLIVWYAMRGNEGTNNYGPHPSTKLDDGTPSVSGEGRRFCSNCGVVLRDGASFCPSCGVQMSSASWLAMNIKKILLMTGLVVALLIFIWFAIQYSIQKDNTQQAEEQMREQQEQQERDDNASDCVGPTGYGKWRDGECR